MKAIGLDIGTTTICGVLVDGQTGMQLEKYTVSNDASLTASYSWQKLQDPDRIEQCCFGILNKLIGEYLDIAAIGVTGQMHGILYLNSFGEPVSPLITWQDGRGNQTEHNGITYAQSISDRTGRRLASGFGAVTHYWNTKNHRIPDGAVTMCTIADYIAMRLADIQKPVLHSSMAASLGLFNLEDNTFDEVLIQKAGMESTYFPQVQKEEKPIGFWKENISISAAFGDNQASFLGAVPRDGSVLVNVGTGSQISVLADQIRSFDQLECRPYRKGKYLYVGSSLCGGYAYALLKRFYESVFRMSDMQPEKDLYTFMNKAAANALSRYGMHGIQADVRFNGSRIQPDLRGKIENISVDNFDAESLTLGILQGICKELYEYYLEANVPCDIPYITGSGNGIRKNPLLQHLFELQFGKEVHISQCEEEAACGSALFSLSQTDMMNYNCERGVL